jgi:hypothetical protein
MGRVFSGRDTANWKVVSNGGKVLRYPEDHHEKSKRGKPMNDLSGFAAANELARAVGGYAVRA